MNPFKQNRALRFLGSVQLALPMLLILAVILATGTIVEAVYSTAVAKRFVYDTWWFGGFLLLLAVNLLCSALSRFPWKKHQTGFVITHVGIILILAGSFVTQQWGFDGQMPLDEGQEGHIFQESDPVLYYQVGQGEVGRMPAAFPFRLPSPGHPLLARLPDGEGLLMVDQFYLNAQKEIAAKPAGRGEKGFPAVRLDLSSSFVQQDQWLFAGSSGNGHLDLGPASVYFEKEDRWKRGVAHGARDIADNALAVLLAPGGGLKYQVRLRGRFQPARRLDVGRSYPTGWMDMRLKVQERLSDALPEASYAPLPLPHQQDPQPALHYEVIHGSDKKSGWLGFEDQASFSLAGKTFSLAYGPKQVELPFTLHLVKFTVGFDPGTHKPSSYSSRVFYINPRKGTEVPAVISMNEPLHYEGYTIYQASYEPEPGGKYISVFSVGKDPGVFLKYTGAVVLVLGLVFMFWFKNPAWNKREANA